MKDRLQEFRVDDKDKDPRYQDHKLLNRLLSQEEIDNLEAWHESRREVRDYDYERVGYMERQPRNIIKSNYNYEQFKEYTKQYKDAMKKDEEKSREFYKMVKYVKSLDMEETKD